MTKGQNLDNDGSPNMMAFVWVKRNRRDFITNRSSLVEGDPHVRIRWRQCGGMFAKVERLELTVPTPQACNIYYDTCGTIHHSYWQCQDYLQIERKIPTKNLVLPVSDRD